MQEIVFPKRIVLHENVKNPENLLKKKALQVDRDDKKTSFFEKGSFVILDFGLEMCGSVRILTDAAEQTKVRIRFGESVSETCSEIGGEKNATNDHATRDFYVNLPKWSDLVFGNSGFRFVRLDFEGDAEIKCVVAMNNILKKKPLYVYKGSDERIREIYQTAKRTVDLCIASGYLWDGVKRDRLVWIGDIHPEMLALTTLYGRLYDIEKSLDFVRHQTPLPGWMNRYPTYSLWWIIIVADYFEKTKYTPFAKRQIPYLEKLLLQIDCCVKENGELNYPRYFVDWPTREKPDEIVGVRAINIIAMKKAISLLKVFEKDTSLAEDILGRLEKIEIKPEKMKQVFALKFFAKSLTEEDKKRLLEGGAKGMSTFMSYYILKAVASFDREAAISMMKEYYGAMLDKGATTFWEDFDLSWTENAGPIDTLPKEGEKDIHGDFGAYCYKGFRHSLCHGWSAGVIRFIEEECK